MSTASKKRTVKKLKLLEGRAQAQSEKEGVVQLTTSEHREFSVMIQEMDQTKHQLGELDVQIYALTQQQDQLRKTYMDRQESMKDRIIGMIVGRGFDPNSGEWHLSLASKTIQRTSTTSVKRANNE